MKYSYPKALGSKVAAELCTALSPACERIVVAGSLRRGSPKISDVEIVYIARNELRKDPSDMFATVNVNLADEVISVLEANGILDRRKNKLGSEMFGPKNKLMRHRVTGMPVDLFAANIDNWWNYLVCRTGPAESNERIATAARARGWKWNPYDVGFTHLQCGDIHTIKCEEDVFAFVGLPYAVPEKRR